MLTKEVFTTILDIKELEVTSVTSSSTTYHLSVCSILSQHICPKCGQKCSRVKSSYRRKVKDLPISGKKVILDVEVRQFECDCGNFFTEKFSFVRPKKHLSIRYERYLYMSCKGADIKYVAQKEELDWRTVDALFYHYSEQVIKKRTDWDGLTHVALDEIALKKGHNNYVVVIFDLLSGIILDIIESREKAFLIKYFRDRGAAFCEQIKVFCSDMWKAYLACAKAVFPNATIIADRFHFFANCQKGIDHARKSYRKTYPEAEELKRLKYPLLKNPENLTDKDKEKLSIVFNKKEYELLYLTWNARNLLRAIFNSPLSISEGEKLIDQWIVAVKELEIRFLFKFIDFYQKWKHYILTYFKGRFTTGKLEGTNNKLKLIKRRAFGFLKFEHFRMRAIVEFF